MGSANMIGTPMAPTEAFVQAFPRTKKTRGILVSRFLREGRPMVRILREGNKVAETYAAFFWEEDNGSRMQLEIPLDDWRSLSSAPQNATWVRLLLQDGNTVRAHYAEGGGEEQPYFQGWFREGTNCFVGVYPHPVAWRPLR